MSRYTHRQYGVGSVTSSTTTSAANGRVNSLTCNPGGATRPLGPQQVRSNFPVPYDQGVWRLADIVEYGGIAVFAALEQMAKYRARWLENFYLVHKHWVERDEA